MSDTPRTDAEEVYYSEIVTGRDKGLYWVRADFVRQLERELEAYKKAWHDQVLHVACATNGCQFNAAPAAPCQHPHRHGVVCGRETRLWCAICGEAIKEDPLPSKFPHYLP